MEADTGLPDQCSCWCLATHLKMQPGTCVPDVSGCIGSAAACALSCACQLLACQIIAD